MLGRPVKYIRKKKPWIKVGKIMATFDKLVLWAIRNRRSVTVETDKYDNKTMTIGRATFTELSDKSVMARMDTGAVLKLSDSNVIWLSKSII